MTDLEHFQELAFYTLSKGDAEFMHQHAVDAYAAQHAGLDTKPVSLVFGLIGLYLALDKGWTGRQVQLFHMKMARYKRPWPVIPIPPDRGDIIVEHVLATEPGALRDRCIMDWCASVWTAYADVHFIIVSLVADFEAYP